MPTKDIARLSDDALIKAHLQEVKDAYPTNLKLTDPGRFMLAADAERKTALVVLAIQLWIKGDYHKAGGVASELLRSSGTAWTSPQLARVVETAALLKRGSHAFGWFQWFPQKPIISTVEKLASRELISPELRSALQNWKAALAPRELTPAEERAFGEASAFFTEDNDDFSSGDYHKAEENFERLKQICTPLTEERKLLERLSNLLSEPAAPGSKPQATVKIDATDAVGAAISTERAKGGRACGSEWAALLQHARSLQSTAPSKKWLSDAVQLTNAIDRSVFASCVADWFAQAGKPVGKQTTARGHIDESTLLNDCSVELLKGIAWAIVAAQRAELAPALGTLAEACYKKIPNKGPRNVKVANAATAALAALANPEAAAQLLRLRLRVKHRSARATVDKALKTASQKTGLTPDELTEMSVPTFGLDKKGVRVEKIGEHTAELRVIGASKVALSFLEQDKPKRRSHSSPHSSLLTPHSPSIPPIIRKGHPDALKRLQQEAKDASTMLRAQALRLERLLISERNWAFSVWKERYLSHPLVGTLGRRLIWRFNDTLALPHDGDFITAQNRKLAPNPDAIVSLWHPVQSKPDEVLLWRQWLENQEIVQPFKQAHREIYVLTDAERKTETYSNRFAAHILRQHQFAALCQERGWDYSLQGDFDSYSCPRLTLAAHNLAAEFFVEPIEGHLTPRFIHLYLSTDQVRFLGPAASPVASADNDGLGDAGADVSSERYNTPIPLAQIPPFLFSEVMRDVDLFVGVASVASDPTWSDSAERVRGGRDYWQQWSFGDLSEAAKTRKTILERLIPRLNEAERFSLRDKYLIVKGDLRTYRIHLGSTNILMEPNDQYLCIVRAPKNESPLLLPFEGDNTLALILSKALLLADDRSITDPTITRQIKS